MCRHLDSSLDDQEAGQTVLLRHTVQTVKVFKCPQRWNSQDSLCRQLRSLLNSKPDNLDCKYRYPGRVTEKVPTTKQAAQAVISQ